MKNAIKIIIGLHTIAGGIIGYMSIKNLILRRRLGKCLSELAENCVNTVSLEDLNWEDDREPIEPIPIYVYK
ncbi:MAG: hypothetical protein IKU29_03810 [Parabacteroides sp.]|nr:hypothetical protein [Parabacteroides sp.]